MCQRYPVGCLTSRHQIAFCKAAPDSTLRSRAPQYIVWKCGKLGRFGLFLLGGWVYALGIKLLWIPNPSYKYVCFSSELTQDSLSLDVFNLLSESKLMLRQRCGQPNWLVDSWEAKQYIISFFSELRKLCLVPLNYSVWAFVCTCRRKSNTRYKYQFCFSSEHT